jgi:hypothetical protein
MILATSKWFLKVPVALAGLISTWLFGWFFCLFYYRQEESRVTGYPSQFPGKLREHIDFPFEWAGTFDDCADAHWYSGRTQQLSFFGWKPFANMTEAQYLASPFVRYLVRVFWMYRNAAYKLGRDLGYDQTGMTTEVIHDQDVLWDKGVPNITYKKFKNAYGQVGFIYQRQIHLGNQWFIELIFGYKAPWENERKNRAPIAYRVVIKKYNKLK